MNILHIIGVLGSCFLVAAAPRESTSPPPVAAADELVVLVHGLARSERSMQKLERRLQVHGYRTCNVSYPSRDYPIEILTEQFILPQIETCGRSEATRLHFVTHSMGGIAVRYLLQRRGLPNIGRIVMLSPPNKGSEVVDKIGGWTLFKLLNGPAGLQLGTSPASFPNQLGRIHVECGIITGSRTVNLFLSMLIPGVNDGKVSIANAQLEGMQDFLIAPVSHPFIMKNERVITQVIHFLRHGAFQHAR